MKLRPLFIVQITLLLGFACIYLLPKQPDIKNSAIIMKLPAHIGLWSSEKVPPSQGELEALAKDTEFEKRNYWDGNNKIYTSIVLSGRDPNNSIHRPERCMRAHGDILINRKSVSIRINKEQSITVTRILSKRAIQHEKKSYLENITYYWFVGHDFFTAGHYSRSLKDIWDRICKGYDQRWAYVSLSAFVTESLENKGMLIDGKTIEETDTLIQDFIQKLFPHIHQTNQIDNL